MKSKIEKSKLGELLFEDFFVISCDIEDLQKMDADSNYNTIKA